MMLSKVKFSKHKSIIVFCAISVLIINTVGCSAKKDSDSSLEQYEVTGTEYIYEGYINPTSVESYDLSLYTPTVNSGDFVDVNQVIATKNDDFDSKISSIQKQIDSYEDQISELEAQVSDLENGDFTDEVSLNEEYKELQYSIEEAKRAVSSAQVSKEAIEISYNNNYTQYKNTYDANITKISSLNQQLSSLLNNVEAADTADAAGTDIAEAINDMKAQISTLESENNTILQNIDYLKKTYENDINSANLIVQSAQANLNKLTEQYANYVTGSSITERLNSKKDELENLSGQVTELNEQLNTYLEESEEILADFAGMAVIDNLQLHLYSINYEFLYVATQSQVELLQQINQAYLSYNNEIVGLLTYSHYQPGEEKGNYDVIYTIETDQEKASFLPYAIADLVYRNDVYIPDNYIDQNDTGYYVIMDGEITYVDVKLDNGQYLLLEGVSVGDVIDKITEETN